MNVNKNKRFKPFYKKFVKLDINIQNKKRLFLFKFKKQKWKKFNFSIQRLKNRNKRFFRYYDINKCYLPNSYNFFKRKYKNIQLNKKKLNYFYGNFSSKFLKKLVSLVKNKKIKNLININSFFLSIVEKKIDIILYRASFVLSIKQAKQLIVHQHIKINGIVIKNSNCRLKQGDIITISKKIHYLVYHNICNSVFWPSPPKYLHINYKILEIMYNLDLEFQNISILFSFWIDLEQLFRFNKS